MKKILSILLALIIIIGIVPIAELDLQANAASFTPRLSAPTREGYYGTQNAYNPFRTNSNAGNGNCTWYAWGRAYEILGSRPKIGTGNASTWYGTSSSYAHGSTPKLGAIACWSGGSTGAGHVAVVEQINNDGTIVISESSWSATTWWFRTKTISSNGYYGGSLYFQGYIYLGDFSSAPPTNIWISLPNGEESSYLPNTEVDITFGADNATSYYLEMYRRYNGETSLYYTETFTSGICYASFKQLGHYSCFVVARNATGSITSKWIGWDIVDAPPTNVWVSLPNGPESSYKLNEQVDIKFGAEYADTYHIIMCREYNGIVDCNYYKHSFRKSPNGNDVCHASFDKPGHYSCYINATNMVGGTSSEWIGWDIVESAPSNLNIKVNNDNKIYLTNEAIKFTLNADYGFYKHIGIHKSDGTLITDQDVAGTEFEYNLDESGDYYADFDAFNVKGSTRSEKVYFKVIDPLLSIEKSIYSVTENITFLFNVPDSYYKHIGIHKTDNTLIYDHEVQGSELIYNISEPGDYYAEFDSINSSINSRSNRVYFSVVNQLSVRYVTNSKSNINEQKKDYNIDLKLSSEIPVKTGFIFTGWNTQTDSSGKQYQPGDLYTENTDLTLYAHWSHDTFILKETELSTQNKLITGSQLLSMSAEDLRGVFNNTNISVNMKNSQRMATGTTVNLIDDTDTVYDTMTVVIRGDVDCDGLIDGRDSFIVDCLANNLLSKDQVGEAVFTAADCNRNGEIDAEDIALLEGAGLKLNTIEQI